MGVPGSVIEQFFSIVATNDLPSNVMADAVVSYADDATLLSKHQDIATLHPGHSRGYVKFQLTPVTLLSNSCVIVTLSVPLTHLSQTLTSAALSAFHSVPPVHWCYRLTYLKILKTAIHCKCGPQTRLYCTTSSDPHLIKYLPKNARNRKFNKALRQAEDRFWLTTTTTPTAIPLCGSETPKQSKYSSNNSENCNKSLAEEIFESKATDDSINSDTEPISRVHLCTNILTELESSLAEDKQLSEEDELTIAAKVGAALLEENKILNQQCDQLTTILNTLKVTQEEYMAIIEDLETKEHSYLTRIEQLQGKLIELENTLEKEKKQSKGLTKHF
ncbi:hypothetical protein J6590_041173 [Homalodisca vitripennis]|nr:hypothetical protein J6590_041173 [Homalodisca vitripennis]